MRGIDKYMRGMKPRRSPSLSLEVIREGFLEEGVVPGQRGMVFGTL